MKNKILSALLVGTILALAAPAQAATTIVFTGVDVAHNSWSAYLGGVTALSGQDITSQDGWLARAAIGYGEYDYDRPGILSDVDGDYTDGDLMIGYGHSFGNGRVSAYLGGNYQHHDLSPDDPLNEVEGGEGGVKGQLEFRLAPVDHVTVNAIGSYSTAFENYWSRLDVGYNFGGFSVGPEVGLYGNDEFNAARFGGQIRDIDLGFAAMDLHGGWVNSNRRDGDGGYGALGFSKLF
ncbi:MAG: cellulose biosynthesis protein BcsS [Alphaproteobacteria bacterium]|nr:MAG: cellulose biosynthesis protein BcsS [Alphaproteobacteria bacterium]